MCVDPCYADAELERVQEWMRVHRGIGISLSEARLVVIAVRHAPDMRRIAVTGRDLVAGITVHVQVSPDELRAVLRQAAGS